MTPTWLTAFLDLPAERYDAGLEFWRAVTGWRVSEPRGEEAEFVSRLPGGADPHLRAQRLASGRPRVHVDLHVADPRAAAAEATALGAREVEDRGYVVMTSPGGMPFCLVPACPRTPVPAAATEWADGAASLVDQVCVDVPGDSYDTEADFWASLTGRSRSGTVSPEFERLAPPPGQPVHLLLQRLEERSGPVRAHLDLACTGRERETRRQVRLGAVVESVHARWTVLRDPAGAAYCITDRTP